VSKRTDSPGLGSLTSGALTGASLLVVSAVAAVVGVVIAREFGRTDETDGLLAAYGVFIVIGIAAQAIRVALLPQLARAWADGRLAGEIAGYALALAVVAVPLIVTAELGAQPFGGLLAGHESEVAQDTAAHALRWMVPASLAYLFAGLAASGLAARDDYGTAAFAYAAGSISGLALILFRVEPDGIIAVAWGMTLNGAIVLVVTTTGLAVHAVRTQMPARAVRPSGRSLRARLATFAVGASLPLALQLVYVLCLPFAARLGTGAATSFVYAYLTASSLVAVTAGSLGLVTSVPLARAELSVDGAARHVVSASWLALALVGAAAGTFALAGGDLVEAVLGDAYSGDVGSEVGRLVVTLSPWMIASVGASVAFPLAFVARRTRGLPWIALGALLVQVPLAWAGSELLELDGLAVALAVSTLLVFAALLVQLHTFMGTARGFVVAAGVVAGVGAAAFVPSALVLGPFASAALGLVAYVALLAALRPRGLVESWHYLRELS
jgi:hypothetical protein